MGVSLPDRILDHARIVTAQKGDMMFNTGRAVDTIFVTLEGRVALTAHNEKHEETLIEILPAGNLFLIQPLILEVKTTLTARAIGTVKAMHIPADVFMREVDNSSPLVRAALRQISRQWRLTLTQLRQLKLLSASERLAHYVLSRLDADQGRASLILEEERRLIAQRLGMTPESLSRAIASLREQGVSFNGRTVTVNDVQGLHEFCGLSLT